MSDSTKKTVDDDLENEKPSTVKEGFQRWLIVAGVLITLLFVYLFFAMSAKEKEKEVAEVKEEEVPQQVQEAATPKSEAIQRFQESINEPDRSNYGEKVKTTSIKEAYAPRKTASYKESQESSQKRQTIIGQSNNQQEEKKTPYQQYLENEQMRAYKSLSSQGSIGDDSAFYDKEPEKKSSQPTNQSAQRLQPRESIQSKQQRIRGQIQQLTEYRKAIERGEINPNSPPPGLTELLEANR